METTPQLSDVLALGKRLVAELDSDENGDTLSHWMAHHIASLMQNIDTDLAEDRCEREQACRRAILELWAHRRTFRREARPFAKLDRVIETLQALDPDAHSPFYFRELTNQASQSGGLEERTSQMLNLACSLDRGARTLIGYCLSRAAEDATDQAASWVEMAQKAGSSLDADIKIVRIITNNSSVFKDMPPVTVSSHAKNDLLHKVEYLDELSKALAGIQEDLIARIGRIDTALRENERQIESKPPES